MVLFEAMGIVTRGNLGLVDVLDPYFREVLGEDYRTRLANVSVLEARERLRKYMKPGEKLSDLVIQMREE